MCTLRIPWKHGASWNVQGVQTFKLVSQLGMWFIRKRFLLGVSISWKVLFIKWQWGRHSPQSDPTELLKLWTYFKILQVQINQGASPGSSSLSTHMSGLVLFLPEASAPVATAQKYEFSGPARFPFPPTLEFLACLFLACVLLVFFPLGSIFMAMFTAKNVFSHNLPTSWHLLVNKGR